MEISNLLEAEFKALVIRMLKELTGYFNGIKKTRADMKVKLSEIEKNLQGANSGVDEAKIQINDFVHNKELSIQPEQQEEKIIQKNEDSIRCLWEISTCIDIRIIGARRRRGRATN